MAIVGIIANPAAGKDIRRLVAHASTFDNNEKVSIVRRLLLGLEETGVEEVRYMPEYFGIVPRALRGLNLTLRCTPLEMEPEFAQVDSTHAAARLLELGAGCIVTLGGDGTNRVVARACGALPVLPISTGTNNVFPRMIEGTVAGLAAGIVARGIVPPARATRRAPRLEVLRDGEVADIALVDIVVCEERFTGARALWEEGSIRQIICTRSSPATIGFSAIGGYLETPGPEAGEGLALEIGEGGEPVRVPIGPGLIRPLRVWARQRLEPGDSVPVRVAAGMLALDGERDFTLRAGSNVEVRLSREGPRVVEVEETLREAALQGFFLREGGMGTESR